MKTNEEGGKGKQVKDNGEKGKSVEGVRELGGYESKRGGWETKTSKR